MKVSKHENGESNLHTGHYYNIAQLRTELWTNLKLKAYNLAKKKNKQEQEEGKAKMLSAMKSLRDVEEYFAFPGNDILHMLNDFIKHDEFQILKNSIKEILRLLASEDYRQDPDILSFASLLKRKENKTSSETRSKKRYFEVLFVDNL
jgi:arginine decarboxylase